jgi:uncharacterized membrane protein YkvI
LAITGVNMFRFPFLEWLEKIWREITPLNYCEKQGLVINKTKFYLYVAFIFLMAFAVVVMLIGALTKYYDNAFSSIFAILLGVLCFATAYYLQTRKPTVKKDDKFIKWLTTNGKHR